MSMENEPGSVSVFDFLLDKLKNGVYKFESKEEYINQLKNEMKGDPQKTLLYNIYKSTHCKLTTKQKYILFQEIKEYACKISIDDYGMIFNLNKANSFITQIILVIYYKWYHSDYFESESKLSQVCKFLRLINNQGYDISTASSINDNIDASQKYLQIIFKSDRCYGFRTNSINKINFNEEIEINYLFESITKEFKIKITFPDLSNSKDYQSDPHKIIVKFLFEIQFSDNDLFYNDAFVCALIDRVNLGYEKFPDCMAAIKDINHQMPQNLQNTFMKYPFLTINQLYNTKNPMKRYFKETKIWGIAHQPVVKIPGMNLNKIVKWSCVGSDTYQWLLHIAEYSYCTYLSRIDDIVSKVILIQEYGFDISHENVNTFVRKQTEKLLSKLGGHTHYLLKGYLSYELLHKQQYSSSFIKVINEILQKYPADMQICIPQLDNIGLLTFTGAPSSDPYDFQAFLELLVKEDFNIDTIMQIVEHESDKIIFVGQDKNDTYPYEFIMPLEKVFIQVALSDNASQKAQKIKDFMNDNKYVSKSIKSKLMKKYNNDIQELSKMIGKIENLYNFASEWELIDYANMFIEKFLDKFNDETFDEIQSFKDSASDFIKNPSQVAKFQQIIQEINKNASIQELTKQIKSFIDQRSNNIEEKLYFYGQNCLSVNRIDSEIVSSFSKIEILIPHLVEFQSSPLNIKIFTNIKNPSVSSHLNIDSILIFDDSYVILRIDTKSLPNEEIHIHGDIEFETLIIPVHIQIHKVKNGGFIKCDGDEFFFDENINCYSFNSCYFAKEKEIKIITFGPNHSRIPHKISFEDQISIPIEYDSEKKESVMTIDESIDCYLDVKLADDYGEKIHLNCKSYNCYYIFKYYNRNTSKFEDIPNSLYAGILMYRYYFYLEVFPEEELIFKFDEGDLLYLKEYKYKDNILSFDIAFCHQTRDRAVLQINITSKSNLVNFDIEIPFEMANLEFFEENGKIGFQPSSTELNSLDYLYFDTRNNKWTPIRPRTLINLPPFRFVVVSQFTYNWISLSEEYCIETFIDYSTPNLLPDDIQNYCYFVIEGMNWRVVQENEYDPSTMKKLCIRLCDMEYNPEEGKNIWNQTWAPIENNSKYIENILSYLNTDKLKQTCMKLFEFVRIPLEPLKKIKTMKDKSKFIEVVEDAFDHRLRILSQNKYQLRLPMKVDEIFHGQRLINDRYLFSQREYQKLCNEINETKPDVSQQQNLEKHFTFDTINIGRSDVYAEDYFSHSDEKQEEKYIFDFGNDEIKFDCLVDEELNKMKSCDELESIVSLASDLCIKLQLMLQKERTHILDAKFTKAFAFLKNLHSKIEGNYECNSFIESFNFLSSQIETEERNQIQDPFSFPEAFYEEKDLSNSRIVPQKAILQSSTNPTDSSQTTSKQESSENDDSQVEQQVSMPQNQQIPISQNQSFGFMPQQMNINPDQNNFAYIPLQQIPHLATDFNSGLAMNQQMNTSFTQPQMMPQFMSSIMNSAEFGFNTINFQQAAQQFPNYIPLNQCQFMNQNFNIVGQQMNVFGFEQQNQMNQTIQATNGTNIPANMEFSQQDNITIDHNDQTQNQENENEIDEDDSFDDMSGYL